MSNRAAENKPELWIEEDRRLFFAESVTIKATGECFKVEDKLAKIHTYMVDQYNSYRADGKNFYEDQRDIATKCKCTPKTLGKWIKVLETLGLLVIDESEKPFIHCSLGSEPGTQPDFDYPKLLNGSPSYDHEKALERLRKAVEPVGKLTIRLSRSISKNRQKPRAAAAVVETGYKPPTIQSKGTIYTPEQMARFAAEERTKYADGGTPLMMRTNEQ
jgi:hypothetical protein